MNEGWAEVLTQCDWNSVWDICWRLSQKPFAYFYSLVTVAVMNNGGNLIFCGRTLGSLNSWDICYPGTNAAVLSAKHHQEAIIWDHIFRNKGVDIKSKIIVFWIFSFLLWLEVVMIGSLEHQPRSWDAGWNFISSYLSFLGSEVIHLLHVLVSMGLLNCLIREGTFTMLGALQIKITKNYPFLNDFVIKALLFLLFEIRRNLGGDGKKGCS